LAKVARASSTEVVSSQNLQSSDCEWQQFSLSSRDIQSDCSLANKTEYSGKVKLDTKMGKNKVVNCANEKALYCHQKSEIVLEMFKEEQTIAQISSTHGIHPPALQVENSGGGRLAQNYSTMSGKPRRRCRPLTNRKPASCTPRSAG